MSEEVTRDVKNIWMRLFDHTSFLKGEISLLVNEFELKREDNEVTELFHIIENLTDLRDTHIEKIKLIDANLLQLNDKLTESLSLSKKIIDIETKFREDTSLEESKTKRKLVWNQFMDDITEQYSEINNSFEQKEKCLKDCSF